MKNSTLRTVVIMLLVAASAVTMVLFIQAAYKARDLRVQLAELNDVKYGLLDAGVWVGQVSAIVNKRLDEFELTAQNRPKLKRQLEKILDRLLIEVETHLNRERRQETSEVGRALRRLTERIREIFIPFDQLRSGIPYYADAILEELSTPEAKADIKRLVAAGIKAAADSTFTATHRRKYYEILTSNGCGTAAECQIVLGEAIDQHASRLPWLAGSSILAAIAVLVLVTARQPTLAATGLLGATAAIVLLLIGGVATPMIELEARISSLELYVLGEPVTFKDQVLYFQSKSVLDVVGLLAKTGQLDTIVVAVLLAMFSVIFPCGKLIAGFVYYLGGQPRRDNKLIRFFALYSGKWSMADVMVVATFMAYIGFRGLVSSQLDSLGGASPSLEILTTNGTKLMPGFYLFLAFCLLSLLLSTFLELRSPAPKTRDAQVADV